MPLKASTHDRFHVDAHPTWVSWMLLTGNTPATMCTLFGLNRRQLAALVVAEPDAIARLAMSAVYHRLDK